MGNSLPVIALDNYVGSAEFPFHLQLAKSAAINMSKCVVEDCGFLAEDEEKWTVLYTVDGSTCSLSLERLVGVDSSVDYAYIKLHDGIYLNRNYIQFKIRKIETGFLCMSVYYPNISWTKRIITTDACGGVVDLKFYLYGSGNRGGLLVCECKISSDMKRGTYDEETASEVTAAHYFTNCSKTAFNRTETDIGLSVVAKIQVSNGNLDITVEGPQQHPTSALFNMFDQVNRTGIWKPTMCPHCANTQRGRMFWQSGNEDNSNNSVPPVPPHSSQENASIANGGRFRVNGSVISSIFRRYFNRF